MSVDGNILAGLQIRRRRFKFGGFEVFKGALGVKHSHTSSYGMRVQSIIFKGEEFFQEFCFHTKLFPKKMFLLHLTKCCFNFDLFKLLNIDL